MADQNLLTQFSIQFIPYILLLAFLGSGDRDTEKGRQKNLLTRFTPSFMPSVINKSYLGDLRAK